MKWLILVAAIVVHAAEAETVIETCIGGTKCLTCQNAASREECEAMDEWRVCPMNDPVCEVSIHLNSNGGVEQFTSMCKQRRACEANLDNPWPVCDENSFRKRSSDNKGPPDNPGNPGNPGNGDNELCYKCEPGECLPPTPEPPEPCPLHCFTCHGKTADVCWMTGQYLACPDNSMCFSKITTSSSGREAHFRGCVSKAVCEVEKAVKQKKCADDTCFICDNDGELDPAPPKKDVSLCGLPNYGICSCKGDPHCITYDKCKLPSLPGLCEHLLTKDGCGIGETTTFTVYVQMREVVPGRIAIRSVRVTTVDAEVFVGQNQGFAEINGQNTDLSGTSLDDPLVVGSVEVALLSQGNVVRVRLANSVEVFWDYDRAVSVNTPADLESTLCGICGDYNGDDTDDLVYGPVKIAADVCPAMGKSLRSKIEGNSAEHDAEGFSYSWITDLTDAKCRAFCSA